MTTRTAIICNVCGSRLDAEIEGIEGPVEWTHTDRECRDVLRDRQTELADALEALLESKQWKIDDLCRDCLGNLKIGHWPDCPIQAARALLRRVRGEPKEA